MSLQIGRYIRSARKHKGMKVFELANRVGITPVFVTQIEKQNKSCSPEVFVKIFNILSLSNIVMEKYMEYRLDGLNVQCHNWSFKK